MGEPETSGCVAFDFTITNPVPKDGQAQIILNKSNNNKYLTAISLRRIVFAATKSAVHLHVAHATATPGQIMQYASLADSIVYVAMQQCCIATMGV